MSCVNALLNWPVFRREEQGSIGRIFNKKDVGYLLRTMDNSVQILGRVLLIIEKDGKIKN